MRKIFIFCIAVCSLVFFAISCSDITSGGNPELKLLLEHNQVLLPGGENTFAFNYRVTDPVKEGQLEVIIPEGADWLAVDNIKMHDEAYGMITLKIRENIDKDIRNAVIAVQYNFDGNSISEMFNLIQENIPLEYAMEAKYGLCAYGADRYGYFNHHIYLAETDLSQPVDRYFKLDLYTKNDSQDMLPLPGVYTVVDNQYAWKTDFAIDKALSTVRLLDENGLGYNVVLESGQITVVKNGERYNIYGDLFDKDGKCYRIDFEGGFIVTDASHDSTIPDDIDASYSGMKMTAYNVGDKELPKTNMWFITMTLPDMKEGDPIIQLSLAYELDVVDFIEPGVFTDDNTLTPGTYLFGYFGAGYYGSWLFTCNGKQSDGKYEIGSPMAPFKEGRIELKKRGNGNFDVMIDVADDNEHTIKITCTDVPVEYQTDEDLN